MHASSVLDHTAVLHEMYKSNAKVGASEQMLTYCGVREYTSDLFLRSLMSMSVSTSLEACSMDAGMMRCGRCTCFGDSTSQAS